MNKSSKGTRIQHCSLCKNHGLLNLKKKHHCDYENCTCDFCDLTKRCQKAMRHQQRLWRHQKTTLGQLYRSGEIKGQVCDKCRNHNIIEQKKDHACPYAECTCSPCNLNHVRKELMKFQQRVRRSNVTESEQSKPQSEEKEKEEEANATSAEQKDEFVSAPPSPGELVKKEPPSPNDDYITHPSWNSPPAPLNEPCVPSESNASSPMMDSPEMDPIQSTPQDLKIPSAHTVHIQQPLQTESGGLSRTPPPLIHLKWPIGFQYLPSEIHPSLTNHPSCTLLHPKIKFEDSYFMHRHRDGQGNDIRFESRPSTLYEDSHTRSVSPEEDLQRVFRDDKFTPSFQPMASLEKFAKGTSYDGSPASHCPLEFLLNRQNIHRPIPLAYLPGATTKPVNFRRPDISF